MKEYLDTLTFGGKSPRTIRSYEKDLNKLYKFLGVVEYKDFETFVVADYMRFYNSETSLSHNSLKGLIRNLSAFFSWMVDSGYIASDKAFKNVKFGKSRYPKVAKKKKVVLNHEETEMVIQAGRNLQEKLMLALMFKTALRRSEVSAIQMSHINGNEILLDNPKGGTQHYTYMDEELLGMLNDYLENERDTTSPFLFYSTRGGANVTGELSTASVYNRVKECAKLSGISQDKVTGFSPHRARGTAITITAIKYGLTVAQALGRHADVNTTKAYVETDDRVVKDLLLGNL